MSRPRPHLTPEKDPVPIVQEAGWASGPVWTGAENLASTGIRSPDRPARRQALYELRYPAHRNIKIWKMKIAFVLKYQKYETVAVETAAICR